MKNHIIYLLAIFVVCFSCKNVPEAPVFADTIYFNGTILTMEGNAPETVEMIKSYNLGL